MTTLASSNPFKVKGVARGAFFFNRSSEIELLVRHAIGFQHTLILAPRRFGKTSLLEKVAEELEKQDLATVVAVDLFKVSSLPDFFNHFGTSIVKSQRGPLSKLFALFKKGLPSVGPKVTINALGEPEFTINVQAHPLTIHDIEELLVWFDHANGNRKKLIILDEIQELAVLDESGAIERHLRAVIQKLNHTTFFYSGSLPTLLKEMFFNRKRPFFQSALRMDLGLCPPDDCRKYLKKHFKNHLVAENLIEDLIQISQGHPYYVQLQGYFLWESLAANEKGVLAQDITRAIFQQERTTFENAISLLTPQQKQVFRAIAKESGQKITANAFLQSHRLPGHSSVRKATQRLEALGFIIRHGDGFKPADPLLGLWWAEG